MNKFILLSLLCFILSKNSFSQDKILIADLKISQKEVKIRSLSNKSIAGKVVNESATTLEIQVNTSLIIIIEKKEIKSLHLIENETIGQEIKIWKAPKKTIEKDSILITHDKVDSNLNLLTKKVKITTNNKKTVTGEVILENKDLITVKVSPVLEVEVKKQNIIKIETVNIIDNEVFLDVVYNSKKVTKINSYTYATQNLGFSTTAFGSNFERVMYENHNLFVNSVRIPFSYNVSMSLSHYVFIPYIFNVGLKYNNSMSPLFHYGFAVNSLVQIQRPLTTIYWFRPIFTFGSKSSFINLSPGFVPSRVLGNIKTMSFAGQINLNSNYPIHAWFDSNFISLKNKSSQTFMLGLRHQKKTFHIGVGYFYSNFFLEEGNLNLPYFNVGSVF